MAVACAERELIRSVVEHDALIIGCCVLLSCRSSYNFISLFEIPAAGFNGRLELLAKRDAGTTEVIIEEQAVRLSREERLLAEADLEVRVVTLCKDTRELNIISLTRAAVVGGHIRRGIETSDNTPVIIDLTRGIQTEEQGILVLLILAVTIMLRSLAIFYAVAPVAVTGLAGPFDLVALRSRFATRTPRLLSSSENSAASLSMRPCHWPIRPCVPWPLRPSVPSRSA